MNKSIHVGDTIAAVSTPLGSGGIGIVRISGEKAFEIIEKIFLPAIKKEPQANSISYGHIVDPNTAEVVDEVLISYFKKPKTFTREDITEINCHGGINVVRRILELVINSGARIADPGEFTMRAFMNGRIDLSQAEAVIDIINAKSNSSRKASIKQLEGKLSKKIKEIRDVLVDTISDVEAAIDYPEYDIEEISREKIANNIEICLIKIKSMTKTFFEGRIVREGLETAIIGKPNVGKSSLLNALTQKEKAIITDIPGTTRDVIEEFIEVGGIAVKILDTAGLRETSDYIEKEGIDRTKKAIENADLVLLLLDGSEELSKEDRKIAEFIRNKKTIVIINKTDLEQKLDIKAVKILFENNKIIEVSAKQEWGLENIEKEIKEIVFKGEFGAENEIIITSLRHKKIIEETQKILEEAIVAAKGEIPIDMVSVLITESANKLGEITGETAGEEILKSIFAKFCVGK